MNVFDEIPVGCKIITLAELFDNVGGSVPEHTVLYVVDVDSDCGDLKLADEYGMCLWYYFEIGNNLVNKMVDKEDLNPLNSIAILKGAL